MDESSKPKDNPWHYASLGTQLAAAVGLGAGLGYWIDSKKGTGPWGMILGAAVGLSVGMYQFFKDVLGAKKS